jgi:hypothetical protein
VTDDEERQLKGKLLMADIANKDADTAYKTGLLRFEPWKIGFTGLAAGAALAGVLIALGGYLHRDAPPPTINVHLDAPLVVQPGVGK